MRDRDMFIIASDPVTDGWKIAAFKYCDGETGFLVTAGNCLTDSGLCRFVAALESARGLAQQMETAA